MKLIVHEITTSVSQNLTPEKNTQVTVVRPHLYIHNKPTGTLKVAISQADGTLLGESSEIDIQDMTTLSYFHGYIRFNVSAHLKRDVEYKFSIVASGGYSFSESGYVGVCNDYDLRKYETDQTVEHPLFAPKDLEIWSLSKK